MTLCERAAESLRPMPCSLVLLHSLKTHLPIIAGKASSVLLHRLFDCFRPLSLHLRALQWGRRMKFLQRLSIFS